jgi:HEAT repeat protein
MNYDREIENMEPHILTYHAEDLGIEGDPAAIPTLFRILRHEDPTVREGALAGLSFFIEHQNVVDKIEAIADSDPDPMIRDIAKDILDI